MAAADVVIKRLLDEVIPLIKAEINLHRNSKKEAQTLVSNLQNIKLILDDAERKQLRDPLIKSWLEKLQGLAYDVEDALDNWEAANRAAAALPSNSEEEVREEERRLSLTKKVRLSIQSVFSCCKGVVEHRSIALEIKDLNEQIEQSYKSGINSLHLLRTKTPTAKSSSESQKKPKEDRITTSGFVKSRVHGRDTNKEIVKEMLFYRDEKEKDTIPIVSIVGQGGLGKTTLAKIIYGDDIVQKEFPLRIWVCVSDPFDHITVAKQILEQLEISCLNVSTLEALHNEINNGLQWKKKQFLLVLDDVWTEDHTELDQLHACLKHGEEGSKILVTTRKQNTARALGASQVHSLQRMSDGDCWSIISQIALFGRNDQRHLEAIGKDIAKKCDGLPLAAHVMGGLLQKNTSVQDWRRVLNSEVWELENVENELFRHFFLSYDELDPATKRCFSFCAVFPKDFDIRVDKLIRMWMAHGFLSSSTREMEVQGQIIFDDLSQHSFFQDFEKSNINERVIKCKMHDIVHDFSQYLTKNECGVVEGINSDGSIRSSFPSARHLSWPDKNKPESLISCSTLNAEKLRTLFCMNGLPSNFLNHFKCVRELRLNMCSLSEIPGEIGNLVHLRYLDLSENDISFIPEGICNLCNLQTLDLSVNYNLPKELPEEFLKKVNLRHLLMDRILLSKYLGRLTNLRTLNDYLEVKKEDVNSLGCLKNLNLLEGNLNIGLFGLDKEADMDGAKNAALIHKKSIQSLKLYWNWDVKLEVVEALQPNLELQSLVINGNELPSWIMTLENLVKLDMTNFSTLPPLGKLQFLEELRISQWFGKCVGREFLGLKHDNDAPSSSSSDHSVAFPSLKTLYFFRCCNWIEWEDISEEEEANGSIVIMPCLSRLEFLSCDLKVMPDRLLRGVESSLQTLKISMSPHVKTFYQKFQDRISHIPNVDIWPLS